MSNERYGYLSFRDLACAENARVRKRKIARSVATWFVAALLGGIFGAQLAGCTPVRGAARPSFVLHAREAEFVDIIAKRFGIEWRATTLHGVTIYQDDDAAADRCLRVHEDAHARQEVELGIEEYKARYLAELGACLAEVPRGEREAHFGACYQAVSFEAEARLLQYECLARMRADRVYDGARGQHGRARLPYGAHDDS